MIGIDRNIYKLEYLREKLNSQLQVIGQEWRPKRFNYDDFGQTIFPQNWDMERIIHECASSFNNPVTIKVPSKSNYFYSKSVSGIEIHWYIGHNGKISTFFPKFNY